MRLKETFDNGAGSQFEFWMWYARVMKNLGKLLISVIGCELVGALATPFTISSIDTWYKYLNKPSFSPPNWIFGPVWTLLYFLMGISLFLIWKRKQNKETKEAIKWFFIQLLLNFLWSLIFFGGHQITLAFLDIAVLLAAIYLTIKKFEKLNKIAGYLLLPYIFWVGFATILNLSILLLNK